MKLMSQRIAGRISRRPILKSAPQGILALKGLNSKARSATLGFSRQPPEKSYGQIGNLEVRLAQTRREIQQAQRLRYEVFYEEMAATPSMIASVRRLDQDPYDAICDHLLVVDRSATGSASWSKREVPGVVGTYRVLRQDSAQRNLGFYSEGEYAIGQLLAKKSPEYRFMELGRSCVLKPYRTKRTVELLWHGLWRYVREHKVDVMIGCASLTGTDPSAHEMALSFLHHNALAPPQWRCRAHDHLYVPMDRIAKDRIDAKAALKTIPPLIKGYLRLGAYVGDGAVIDRQFGTTDVLVILPVENIDPRYFGHFGAPDELRSGVALDA
jgi:L-ornithine Nalpha-acyltransferase